MSTSVEESYDLLPYVSEPQASTNPMLLATMGHLYGIDVEPLQSARVLEIGCSTGGNLINLASMYGSTQFVGVDISRVQIEQARESALRWELDNIEFQACDITAFEANGQSFDYILCHGVFSWVSTQVRHEMLSKISSLLSKRGLALITYNSQPGFAMLNSVRSALKYHVRNIEDVHLKSKSALDFLKTIVELKAGSNEAYQSIMETTYESLKSFPLYYLGHEYLEDENIGFWLEEFTRLIESHGLQYVTDISIDAHRISQPPDFFENIFQSWSAETFYQREFLVDLMFGRKFRHSIICKDGVDIKRAIAPERLFPLSVNSALYPAQGTSNIAYPNPETFYDMSGAEVQVSSELCKAALYCMGQHFPRYLPFEIVLDSALQLLQMQDANLFPDPEEAAQVLATELLTLYSYSNSSIGFSIAPPGLGHKSDIFPKAYGHALRESRVRPTLPTLLNKYLKVRPETIAILSLCDGHTSHAALLASIADDPEVRDALMIQYRDSLNESMSETQKLQLCLDLELDLLSVQGLLEGPIL